MRTFYLVFGGVAVVGAGIVYYAIRGGGSGAVFPVELGEMDQQELIELARPAGVYGDTAAPITVMEFGDYQCPACRHFGLFVKPQLADAYISTGKAKLEYYDFPLTVPHPHAFLAARAARCAGDQGLYFEYHDRVFATQEEWSPLGSAFGHLRDLADELEMDRDAFRDCLRSDRHAEVVSANMRLGEELRVAGTPAVFVYRGGPPLLNLGGSSFLDLQTAIDSLAGLE